MGKYLHYIMRYIYMDYLIYYSLNSQNKLNTHIHNTKFSWNPFDRLVGSWPTLHNPIGKK